MELLIAACGRAKTTAVRAVDTTSVQLAVLALFGAADPSGFAEDDLIVWHGLQAFAFGSVNDERALVAKRAASSVAKLARQIGNPNEARFYASALQRIIADPRVEVRSVLADRGPDLVENAADPKIREVARKAVEELENDDNAQVSALLAYAKARLARETAAAAGESAVAEGGEQKTGRSGDG